MLGQAQMPTQPTKSVQSFGIDEHTAASSMNGSYEQQQITPSLMEDLRKQVEFYFSPTNFPKDTYLQTLAATYGGSVPLASILNFPRVRQLVASAKLHHHGMDQQHAEMQLLAAALHSSSTVGISHDGLWIFAPTAPLTHHQLSYRMAPPQHDKGNIHIPYSVMPMQHMMFANHMPMHYNMASHPYSHHHHHHGLQMDHPQHLLPRTMPTYPAAVDGITKDNHHNAKCKQVQPRRQFQDGNCTSEVATVNSNYNGQNSKKKGKGNKKNRPGFGANSVASSSSGGNADDSKNAVEQQLQVQRDRQNNNNNNGGNSNKTNNNGSSSSSSKTTKNKKKQKNNKKDKAQQNGSSNRSNISSEDFPSLTKNKKPQNQPQQQPTVKLANGYAQALLKKVPVASSGASFEDSNSTATTVNTEMEKLAIDTGSDDNCW